MSLSLLRLGFGMEGAGGDVDGLRRTRSAQLAMPQALAVRPARTGLLRVVGADGAEERVVKEGRVLALRHGGRLVGHLHAHAGPRQDAFSVASELT